MPDADAPDTRPTPAALLAAEPSGFSFDAAVLLMLRLAGTTDPGAAIRFHAAPGLAYPAGELTAVATDGNDNDAAIALLALTGPGATLPPPYTELVNAERRQRNTALTAFLDLAAQRAIAGFAAAGFKYRPSRVAELARAAEPDLREGERTDRFRAVLLALAGYGTPHLAERLECGTEPLLYFSGHFASWPRSAERLEAILCEWLAVPVAVEQFAGSWLPVDPDQQSRPGHSFATLGEDAAVGDRVWDVQSCIRIRIGPVDLPSFRDLLPGGALQRSLAELVRSFIGLQTGFLLNPVLRASEVPPLRLDGLNSERLGWSSWLGMSAPRRADAAELEFEPA